MGHSKVTHDSEIIVPIEWDPEASMWVLSEAIVCTRVNVDDDSFPLKDGPVNAEMSADMKAFMDKYTLPGYKITEGLVEEQVDPGHDPECEVEAIVGKKWSGKKARYLVKWKGYAKKTYEPVHHLLGCQKLVQEFEEERKKKGRAKEQDKTRPHRT